METICFLLVMAGKHFLTLAGSVLWHDLCFVTNKKNHKHINGKKSSLSYSDYTCSYLCIQTAPKIYYGEHP